MFSSNTHTPSYESKRDNYVPAPENYTFNSKELTNGLDKVTASFMIIGQNCDNACLKTMDIPNTKYLNDSEQHSFDSCVRSCFVRRLNDHFPDNKEITDFAYSTAFDYTQRDMFSLKLNKVLLRVPASYASSFKSIESVASAFNGYI